MFNGITATHRLIRNGLRRQLPRMSLNPPTHAHLKNTPNWDREGPARKASLYSTQLDVKQRIVNARRNLAPTNLVVVARQIIVTEVRIEQGFLSRGDLVETANCVDGGQIMSISACRPIA
jgi:hypothetical protein